MDRTIEAARRGERDAQSRLLRQLQDPWYRMCLGLLGDADLAREAVQETALRFLQNLHKFRGDSKLQTWSMGIAINVSREVRRTTRAGGGRDLETCDMAAVDDPAGQVDGDEQRQALRAVLEQLPDRQREAVILRFFEQLSVEESARAMGCATGTVKATVHQALRAMRERLKQWM
ncbi:MAG: sigma-70 family RNA polymerase sigma factor [Phycisphaerales bacterium]|nr:sigma-70 family RNA polymerase sigma factor [Phycisphaerales bacterium]